jgi:hypothetical protein
MYADTTALTAAPLMLLAVLVGHSTVIAQVRSRDRLTARILRPYGCLHEAKQLALHSHRDSHVPVWLPCTRDHRTLSHSDVAHPKLPVCRRQHRVQYRYCGHIQLNIGLSGRKSLRYSSRPKLFIYRYAAIGATQHSVAAHTSRRSQARNGLRLHKSPVCRAYA